MILGIYGTGGAAKEIFDLVTCNESIKKNWDEIVFIDDTKESGTFRDCKMYPFSEIIEKYAPDEMQIVVAIGEPKYRKILGDRVRAKGYGLATLIHPLALVSPSAIIGAGVVIQDYVDIAPEAYIHDNVCINGHTIIGHNVEIGENSQVCSHVIVTGSTTVGANTFLGAASAVRDHLSIGENVIISMGAIVMKDVRDNKIVMGNPAREIAENTDQKVFK